MRKKEKKKGYRQLDGEIVSTVTHPEHCQLWGTRKISLDRRGETGKGATDVELRAKRTGTKKTQAIRR